jgi:hypothetical protein
MTTRIIGSDGRAGESLLQLGGASLRTSGKGSSIRQIRDLTVPIARQLPIEIQGESLNSALDLEARSPKTTGQ